MTEQQRFAQYCLGAAAQDALSRFGDLLLASPVNVTAVKDPANIERVHFLDSLTLLDLESVQNAGRIVDVGTGGGIPALVLAIALPNSKIVALESVRKKCIFVESAVAELGLVNVEVRCQRAEEFGQGAGRGMFDVAVARALATLPVVAELCMPLVSNGGTFVAMKGLISNQERIEGSKAAAILGGDGVEFRSVSPFPGSENRHLAIVRKIRETPREYPRRSGVASKKPLGRL